MENRELAQSIKKILEKEEIAGRVVRGPAYISTKRSAIPRELWRQLPMDVQVLLETEHQYNHYNSSTDSIESEETYGKFNFGNGQ